ncbi:MAG: glycosyltransferase [Acidimicrobiales bacterium]
MLFAANGGGHLDELWHLSSRLPFHVDESLWVTFDSPQSRSLLWGQDVRYVRYSTSRDGRATIANAAMAAGIITRGRFDAALSTGATVAVSFLPLAGATGMPAYYIESAARTSGPSLTGRILHLAPWVRLYTQHRNWAGGRWGFAGSVFDAFISTPIQCPPPIRRIVVTVGASETFRFDRFFRALRRLLPAEAEVLWQTGCSDVEALGISSRRRIPAAELHQRMADADLVIAHAGVGSALAALGKGKFPLLIPREKAYGEHVDDHQFEVAEDLAARRLAVVRRVHELTASDFALAASHRVEQLAAPPLLDLGDPSPSPRRR